MIFVKLILGGFGILMSNMSQVQNILLFQGCDKIVLRPILQGLGAQIPPSTSQCLRFPWMSLRHPQTPIRQPPDIPQTPTRHLQEAGDVNRQQQTQTDSPRHQKTLTCAVWVHLTVSVGVCCCLLASLAPWGCLGGVWGMSGGYLGVSEWYSWKLKALGFVWGYLGSQSLQYGAVTLFCHNPETKE